MAQAYIVLPMMGELNVLRRHRREAVAVAVGGARAVSN